MEVGGKRNLPEFAQIAASFEIPTGIVYDEDSDFDDEGEEGKFNAALDSLGGKDGRVSVWCLSKKYEDHLRKAIGEKKYQTLCQKYSNVGKPTRARLIATETEVPIPEPVAEILMWLANKPHGNRSGA